MSEEDSDKERDEANDDDRDDERDDDESSAAADDEDSAKAAPAEKEKPALRSSPPGGPEDRLAKAAKRKKKKLKSKKGYSPEQPARAASPASTPTEGGGSKLMLVAAVALVVGGAIGWFGRESRGMTGVDAAPDPALAAASPSGSAAAGPCGDWSAKVCEGAGATSEACGQAKSAADLLPAAACQQALADVGATIEKVKGARGICDELVKKLCAEIGPDTESCKMVTEKTPSFPTQRCKMMMEGYDQVVKELKAMEAKNAPLTPEVATQQRLGDGPGFGPKDAKVAVIEYSDFECPFCSKAATVMTELKKKYAENVRFVFRQYPLPMHKNAMLAAEASLEAHAQGKFWQMHDLLFANQKALEREALDGYAKQIGLDMDKFKKALDEHTHKAAAEADMKLGETIGVSGTPTMIVGTQRVANPTDTASVAAMIDKQLAQ